MTSTGPDRRTSFLGQAVAAAMLGLSAVGCGGDPASERIDAHARRDLAAAHFAEGHLEQALAELRPLLEVDEPAQEDLGRAGVVALALERPDEARDYFLRVLASDPDSAVAHYNLGQLASGELDDEAAVEHFSRAHGQRPDDLPAELALANQLVEVERFEEADAHYATMQARGLELSGSWYLTVLHRRSALLMLTGREAEGLELLREAEVLRHRGVTVPNLDDLRRGNLGRLLPPEPLALPAAAPLVPPTFGEGVALGFSLRLAGLEPLARGDGGPVSGWVGWGPEGVAVLTAEGEERIVSEEPTARVLPLDLEDDGDLDLLLLQGEPATELRLLLRGEQDWTTRLLASLPGEPRDATLLDFDHEGDLDLCLVGPWGLALLRNDGAEHPDGGFTDATAEAGLGGLTGLQWCLSEDLDTDQDVDLLLGGVAGLWLADNLRGGRFELDDRATGALPRGAGRPLALDHDRDARPDLFFGDGRWFRGRADRTWVERPGGPTATPWGAARDLDGNGTGDALAVDDAGALELWLNLTERRVLEPGPGVPVACADVDGDGSDDLVLLHDGVARLHRASTPGGGGFRLTLTGVKDNARGVGAVVEVRSRELYRRVFYRGVPVRLGLADHEEAQVLRVTWPNGVVQSLVHHPAGEDLVVEQKEGLIGSCPFLYSWDGEGYTFVSDVLGITPLGLPMAPGVFVPPDHDEYVLVTGEQLVAREVDGGLFYDLQLTEELREVTYLDRVRLDVVDHPVGTEVFPDERFCFPPFPSAHTHVAESPRGPLSAREVLASGEPGRDWTAAVAAIDGDLAAPFDHYRGRFQGLARPHTLELTFDGDAVAAAVKLRLFLTGWFYWTDASVNLAAARTPGVDFVPPILQVPDGEGGWRDLGPPVGFPAGKTKTMVVDLTGALDPADPRLRLVSTLRLYWDAIRLATDGDDAPLVVTSVEPAVADLWERGFSKPLPLYGSHKLEWFDWGQLDDEPRWNQHPGQYTRHGDVLPLLGEVDDRFVILGAGDAVHLRFPAEGVPPLPEGWRRDYLLFLDGWAKDRDPNAAEVEFVEPLPFHGMSGFPYGPDEAFPDGELHRAWRREWNTRPAKAWIAPLAPLR